jgi:hypothetical protein
MTSPYQQGGPWSGPSKDFNPPAAYRPPDAAPAPYSQPGWGQYPGQAPAQGPAQGPGQAPQPKPGGSKTGPIVVVAVVAALALGVGGFFLGRLSAPEAKAGPAVGSTAKATAGASGGRDKTAAPSDKPEPSPDQPEPSPAPAGTDPDNLRFGEEYRWGSGVSILVEGPSKLELEDNPYEPEVKGTPVELVVTITNGSDKMIPSYRLYGSCLSGAEECDVVYAYERELGWPNSAIPAGKKLKFSLGYGVADVDDIALIIEEPDEDYRGQAVTFQSP